jgi:hypothetical protein
MILGQATGKVNYSYKQAMTAVTISGSKINKSAFFFLHKSFKGVYLCLKATTLVK